jgi:MtN3 and saliva related transmembrane protein
MNNEYEYVGYTGAFFISINLIPQIYHIYKNKNADSISVTSIALGIISSIIMFSYGILINKFPIIISNGMVFLFYLIILFFKYLYSFSTLNNANINYLNV